MKIQSTPLTFIDQTDSRKLEPLIGIPVASGLERRRKADTLNGCVLGFKNYDNCRV